MKRKVIRNPYRAIYRTALISAAALGVSVAALMGSLAANKDDLIPVAREPLETVEEPAAEPVELEPMPEPLESLGTFMVQSYCPCPECCGEWSAEHPSRVGTGYVQRTISGTIPEAGRTVGVDPDVIPLGTHILILDPNTRADKKRSITVTIELLPDSERQNLRISTTVKSKLEPTNPISTALYITGNENGEPTIVEMVPQIPGQIAMDGSEQSEPILLKILKNA